MITQAAYDTAIKNFEEERAHMQLTIAQLQLSITQLQYQIAQFKELIHGQKSERFISNTPVDSLAPTLFNVEPVAELVELPGKQITYEKTKKESRPNHPGRNAFPEKLRREELVLNPEGLDLSQATKVGEDVTGTGAGTSSEAQLLAQQSGRKPGSQHHR